MVQECYDWVWKLAGYLIFMTAVLQLCPRRERPQVHSFFYRTGADHSDSIACDKILYFR